MWEGALAHPLAEIELPDTHRKKARNALLDSHFIGCIHPQVRCFQQLHQTVMVIAGQICRKEKLICLD